jgi:hypothetical protein
MRDARPQESETRRTAGRVGQLGDESCFVGCGHAEWQGKSELYDSEGSQAWVPLEWQENRLLAPKSEMTRARARGGHRGRPTRRSWRTSGLWNGRQRCSLLPSSRAGGEGALSFATGDVDSKPMGAGEREERGSSRGNPFSSPPDDLLLPSLSLPPAPPPSSSHASPLRPPPLPGALAPPPPVRLGRHPALADDPRCRRQPGWLAHDLHLGRPPGGLEVRGQGRCCQRPQEPLVQGGFGVPRKTGARRGIEERRRRRTMARARVLEGRGRQGLGASGRGRGGREGGFLSALVAESRGCSRSVVLLSKGPERERERSGHSVLRTG